jgi:hypothetical protein
MLALVYSGKFLSINALAGHPQFTSKSPKCLMDCIAILAEKQHSASRLAKDENHLFSSLNINGGKTCKEENSSEPHPHWPEWQDSPGRLWCHQALK